MASYGYARVSTLDQDLTVQRQALRAAWCSVVRAEKASGSRGAGMSDQGDRTAVDPNRTSVRFSN